MLRMEPHDPDREYLDYEGGADEGQADQNNECVYIMRKQLF